jgi:hypothetical protein
MKHKHAELIKAWADGAEIQVFHPNLDTWDDCTYDPTWNVGLAYRIKPDEKKSSIHKMQLNLVLTLETDGCFVRVIKAEIAQ